MLLLSKVDHLLTGLIASLGRLCMKLVGFKLLCLVLGSLNPNAQKETKVIRRDL